MYVLDTARKDGGLIAGGWQINLTLSQTNTPPPPPRLQVDPSTVVFQANQPDALGSYFNIQVSSNLVDWQTLTTIQNTNGIISFSEDGPRQAGARFYRAVLAP